MNKYQSYAKQNRFAQDSLLEQILESDNIEKAWKRVKANNGCAGMDKMSIPEFPGFARKQMPRILEQIRQGRYVPAPVKRVWIAKANGDQRPLGVPTVLDRVIQQAIANVLYPIFDVDFSDNSYGFRQGRRAHDAISKISQASQDGYKWVVDCDLKSFFDVVNHDRLMFEIRKKIRDKAVLGLIGKYLHAGIRHENGATEASVKGIPQGGPLSPLLANIMLDPLDKMIEKMQCPYVRYADDFLIMCQTKVQAMEVMIGVKGFVETRLKLLVNEDKSQVTKLDQCEFLGFKVKGKQIRRSDKSIKRFKLRIGEITARSRGVSMRQRLKELKQYCVGWFHYFKYGLKYAEMLKLDQWIRRRIRLCFWKDWKRPRKRRRMLLKLGVQQRTGKTGLSITERLLANEQQCSGSISPE